MVITFSNIRGSAGGGGATGGTVSGITLWSDETTKAYIDNALSGVTDVLSAYTKTEDFATINGSGITSGGNLVIEATPYTAGANIDITDHIISVTGITLPTKVSELVNDSGYITTADTQNFVTSGDVQTQINDSISGKADSSAVTAQINDVKAEIEAEIPTKVSSLENDLNFVNSADVQTQINDSISGKADSSAVTAQISEVKQEIEAKIPSKVSDLQNDLNFASTGDVKTQIDNAVSGKQDTLVSGTNIKTINSQSLLGSGNIEIQGGGETYSAGKGIGIDADNIISVTGNYETIVELTQAEYDALTSYGKNTTYVITDAPAVNLSAYTPTSGFSTINGNVITDGGNIEIQGGNTYTAGANIDISTDNVISVTGITLPTKLSELTNDEGFVNSGEVESQITGKNYATKNWVQGHVSLAIESETARTESIYAKIGDIPSLDGYASTGWVESQGYLKEHQDISGKLDTSAFTTYTANTQTELNNKQDTSGMTAYATTAFTESTYLKEHQSLSAYSTTEQVQTLIDTAKQEVESEIPDVSNFVTSAQIESKGYITGYTETDPVFQASAASGISAQDITNWNGKQPSGDYALRSELPTVPTSNTAFTNDAGYVNSNEVETQITSKGYITAYTETDPVFQASAASGISTHDITNWNNKLDSSALTPYYTSAQTDTAISNATSGKTDKVSVTASSGGFKFPTWNNQGCITGTSGTAYHASQSINGSSRTLFSTSSSSLPTIYAPTSEGSAGQPLLSNGSGAPVWGAYKFQFISQSQYDALATKDSTTIYFIVNEN